MLREPRYCKYCKKFQNCTSQIKPFSGFNADCPEWVKKPIELDFEPGTVSFSSLEKEHGKNSYKPPRTMFLTSTSSRRWFA